MSVSGWVSSGGAEIGTNRYVPSGDAIAQTAKQVGAHRIDGLLMIGGWAGVPGRARAAQPAAPVSGARHPDRPPAGDHQQRPARHRACASAATRR